MTFRTVVTTSLRRAIVIAIAEFTHPDSAWDPIPKADERAADIAEILAKLDYEVELFIGDQAPPARDPKRRPLGAIVSEEIERLDESDTLIVHLITHGQRSKDTNAIYAVGSDGHSSSDTDIGRWLQTVVDKERLSGRRSPQTLFMLDMCHSGQASRIDWQLGTANKTNRAWVIAATSPHELAYDCRFSRVVHEALTAVVDGAFGIAPRTSHVRFDQVAKDIKIRADKTGQIRQTVTATVIDTADVADLDLPFFPNPAFDERARRTADRLRGLDHRLVEFQNQVDHLVDPLHFTSRALGHDIVDKVTPGVFQGRALFLQDLSSWLNRSADATPRLITGSPGEGKSAILGILVCAAHPVLRAETKLVWSHLVNGACLPGTVAHFAAIHARQQDIYTISTSLGRQLAIPFSGESISPQELVSKVSAMDATPTILLDGLDEALQPDAILAGLLLPLLRSRKPTKHPACRLMIALRRGNEYSRLREAMKNHNGVTINLDSVSRKDRRAEIGGYVSALLAFTDRYSRAEYAHVAPNIAESVATALSAPERTGQPRWGKFLVAKLFVDFLANHKDPIETEQQAMALVRQVPTTLPAVLELSLTARSTPWLRPVLATLAYARGEGMPKQVIRAVAPAFAGHVAQTEPLDLDQVLHEARLYLRWSAVDVDGSTLYRLFHQSLADHLRKSPLAHEEKL